MCSAEAGLRLTKASKAFCVVVAKPLSPSKDCSMMLWNLAFSRSRPSTYDTLVCTVSASRTRSHPCPCTLA